MPKRFLAGPVPPALLALLAAAALACAPPKPLEPGAATRPLAAPSTTAGGERVPEEPPTSRLPGDLRPLSYALDLELVAARDRYAGSVTIELALDKPRRVLWLHGKGVTARKTTVTPAPGTPGAAGEASYEQVNADGVAAVWLAQPMGPGKLTLRIEFDAPFGRQSKGLYRVEVAGKSATVVDPSIA